jgi:dienelactone hydrolase
MAVATCLLAPPSAMSAGAAAGPQGGEDAHGRRQPWLLPSPEPGLMMRAYLFRPPGDGPFPLAVINHGSEEDPYLRARQGMPEFDGLTDWFLARGYAVLLPQRPGHGATGGRYLESQGDCRSADFHAAGMGAAKSIAAAIGFMTTEPFVKPGGVVVAGNSAGAWGGLALASIGPPGVAAVVNFAGGRGGHDQNRAGRNCSPDRLVSAAAKYGRTARIPSLWLYAENDSYFPPDLSTKMADAYRTAGGIAEYHLLPPVPGDGHALLLSRSAAGSWMPVLEAFLRGLKLIPVGRP